MNDDIADNLETDAPVDETFVCVVKIWVEEFPAAGQPLVWRGHVKDVINQDEQYFKTLDELQHYFARKIGPWNLRTVPELTE